MINGGVIHLAAFQTTSTKLIDIIAEQINSFNIDQSVCLKGSADNIHIY